MSPALLCAVRARRIGVAAATWAWLFAAAHVYWALGGPIGLTPAQTTELQVDGSVPYVLSWMVVTYLFAALGLFPLALVWPAGAGARRRLQRVAIGAGYSGMAGLALYGVLLSDAVGPIVLGGGVGLAGAVVGLLRPQRYTTETWMVLVATIAFGIGMLLYGLSYGVAAALSPDAQTRLVYAVTGGVSWTGEGVLFVATAWAATRCPPTQAVVHQA